MKTVKNQYFLKDKKAQLYKTIYVKQSGYYNPVAYYVAATPSPSWCYSSQLSQEQIFVAQSYSQNEIRYFVFNFVDFVDVYSYVLYKGKLYSVTRVDTKDDYNGETFVYVKNVKFSNSDMERLRPYGWQPEDEGLERAEEY